VAGTSRYRAVALRIALVVVAALLLVVLARAPLFDWMAPDRIERPFDGARRVADPPRAVLLISVDGLAPRVLAAARTPTFDRLVREGAAAATARTVLPSYTMPAHASMLSGVTPDVHGLIANRYEPWRRFAAHSLYDVCVEQGLRCGLFAGKRKFAQFAVDEVGVAEYARSDDAAGVLAQARAFLAGEVADFALVHLAEVDWAGHESGWGSPAQIAAVEAIDALLGAFLDEAKGLAPRPLSIILTSDHGGHGTGHGTDRPDDMSIPWLAWGDGVPAGTTLEEVEIVDTATTVLALLRIRAPEAFVGRARVTPRG
jgi:hypothetical protein